MQATASTQRLQELLPELFSPRQRGGDRYLRFQLTAERAALIPLNSIREAMQLPARQVTLLPNLPSCALGLTSAFNQVFCAVDLAQLLGVGVLAGNPRYYALVAVRAVPSDECRERGIVENEPVLGLVVDRIQGVTNLAAEAIAPAPDNLPESLRPFVSGEIDGALVLNIDALIAAPALAAATS